MAGCQPTFQVPVREVPWVPEGWGLGTRGGPWAPSALTTSELKGFALAVRLELLVRDQTLVLCLKAALTFEGRMGWDSGEMGVSTDASGATASCLPRGPRVRAQPGLRPGLSNHRPSSTDHQLPRRHTLPIPKPTSPPRLSHLVRVGLL